MRLLSRHFRDVEFHCPCGECDPDSYKMDSKLVMALQRIRNFLKTPILVTSGARCASHNDSIPGSAKNSWHVPRENKSGPAVVHAADVTYKDSSRRTKLGMLMLYVLADGEDVTGLGLYDGRIHVDTRTRGRGRWVDKSWSWTEDRGDIL